MPEQSGTGGTRIIRSRTIWERIKSWPIDRINRFEEDFNTKDWDEWSQASRCAFLIHVIYATRTISLKTQCAIIAGLQLLA